MSNVIHNISDLNGRSVTIDCNILILLIIGSIGKEHIERFKRTNIFTYEDYLLLINLIKKSTIILTPNILTEASNLLESYEISNHKIGLKQIKYILEKSQESYVKSIELTKSDTYLKFGLSDSSISQLCEKGVVAITIDLPLYGYLSSKSLPVINFNHLRINMN